MNERRLAIFYVSESEALEILKRTWQNDKSDAPAYWVAQSREIDLPEDAAIVGVSYVFERRAFAVMFRSQFVPEIAPGDIVPEYDRGGMYLRSVGPMASPKPGAAGVDWSYTAGTFTSPQDRVATMNGSPASAGQAGGVGQGSGSASGASSHGEGSRKVGRLASELMFHGVGPLIAGDVLLVILPKEPEGLRGCLEQEFKMQQLEGVQFKYRYGDVIRENLVRDGNKTDLELLSLTTQAAYEDVDDPTMGNMIVDKKFAYSFALAHFRPRNQADALLRGARVEMRRAFREAIERRTVAAVESLAAPASHSWGESARRDVERTCAAEQPVKSDKRQALEYDLRRILKATEGSELDRLITVESDPILEESLAEAHSGNFKNAHALLGLGE